MTFEEYLSTFIGQLIEVIVPNNVIQGVLTSVNGDISIQVQEGAYSSDLTTILLDSVIYIRVFAF